MTKIYSKKNTSILESKLEIAYLETFLRIISSWTSLYILVLGLSLFFLTSIHPADFNKLKALLNLTSFFIPVIFCASLKINQEYLFLDHNLAYITNNHFGTKRITIFYIVSQYGKVYMFYCFPIYTTISGDRNETMQSQRPKDIIFDIETTTLDPLEEKAKVIAIGIQYEDNPIAVLMEETEKELLQKFWGLKCFEGWFRLIGFNSFTFDLPYLLVRSFKYGIRIPDIRGKSLDLRFILSYGNKFKKGKLDDFACLFLGQKFKKIDDGSNVETLYNTGKWDELKTYCGNDVFLTLKIYERLKNMSVI